MNRNKIVKTIGPFIIITLIALLPALQTGCKGKVSGSEPNVVLIVLDAMRADHLPFYGYPKNTAPFLTELASCGVVFENAFSTSSWTAPATASIFTSLYPFQHSVTTGYLTSMGHKLELNRIPENVETITELLKKNGYKTYCIGDNINICEAMGFDQGFDRFKSFLYKDELEMDRQLVAWSEEIKAQKKYFLYIHYNDTHFPYHPREPWYEEKKGYKDNIISLYDSEISYVDAKIEKMYELFGWDRNTLFIVVADHGEEFWDHLNKVGHGSSLYDEVLRVPFLICFPGEHPTQKRIKINVSNMDVLPTVRNYLGLATEQVASGINLMPLIRGNAMEAKSRFLFSHLIHNYRSKNGFKKTIFKSIIHDDWKHIFCYNETTKKHYRKELFDLSADPGEERNLYEKNNKTASQLLFKLNTFEKNCIRFTSKIKNINLDKEKIDELKSLGYVR